MANGDGTHEWRIEQLEERMKNVEGKIQTAMYALIGNLVGVSLALLKLYVLGGGR